jgi:hypothetical protein
VAYILHETDLKCMQCCGQKTEGKMLPRICRYRWEDITKKDLKQIAMERANWIVWLRAGTSYGLMKNVLNIWRSTKRREFLD